MLMFENSDRKGSCTLTMKHVASGSMTLARQSGVSMIEVLVTVIILSIGFLGMASMQLVGTRNVSESHYRTLATMYAYDMAERMRSNDVGIAENYYNDKKTTDASVSDPSCGASIATACTRQQIAQRDLFDWQASLQSALNQGGLPNGWGEIAVNATGDEHVISVRWSADALPDDTRWVRDEDNANWELPAGLYSFDLTVML